MRQLDQLPRCFGPSGEYRDQQFSEATTDIHISALMAVGFVLFVITLLVNGIARWMVSRMGAEVHA